MWKREANPINIGFTEMTHQGTGPGASRYAIGKALSELPSLIAGRDEEGSIYARTEKHLVILRAFAVIFTTPILFVFGLDGDRFLWLVVLMATTSVYDAVVFYLLNHRIELLQEGKVTAVVDAAIAIGVTLLGGGFATPWYYCVYAYLLSILSRFGLRAAMSGSFAIISIDGVVLLITAPSGTADAGAYLFRSSFLIITLLMAAFLFAQAKSAQLALERQLEQERSLNQATEVLDATLDPSVVLQAAVDGARRIAKAQYGLLEMKDASDALLSCDPLDAGQSRHGDERAVMQQILRTGQSLIAQQDPNSEYNRARDGSQRDVYLGFPLRRRGNCIGGIVLTWSEDTSISQFEPALSAFAERVTVALENATLYERAQELAVIDPLTGLSNHRYIKERLDVEIERAKRYNHELAAAMFDLDHFKEYNDLHGHGAGDEALKRVAEALRASVRRTDLIGRYGGEEFLLIMPETDLATALSAAERVRVAVDETQEPISVSAGVAAFPVHGSDRDSLLNAVDLATLLAKHQGRNLVRSAADVGSDEGIRAIFSEMVAHLSMPTSAWGPGLASDLERRLKQVGELEYVADEEAAPGGELTSATVETIMALAQTIDAKDPWTEGHSRNVSDLAVALAKALDLDSLEVERIRTAGLLHDIGKIGITDSVLKKPGPLTNEEWSLMRQHPVIGSKILMPVRALRSLVKVVRHHHERYDGNGYPDGLSGENIPLGARILTVCDAYDAMVTKRTYRDSLGHEEAVRRLIAGKGTQFDTRLVDVFIQAVAGAPSSSEKTG